MIVCVEGVDGCGKSTQAALLVERLKAKFFKFPNRDSITGKIIYEHLEKKWAAKHYEVAYEGGPQDSMYLDSMVFQALQVTNRMEFASEIKEAAGRGNVVFDRYWPSGYAYGSGDGLDSDYLIRIHEQLPQPDLFLLLDVDVEDSARRRPERRDRYEEDAGLLTKVAEHYRTLWTRMGAPGGPAVPRWVRIDARGTREQTTELINQAIIAFRGE
jgi:dTMP kinase